jgi:hypothetical protein
MPRWDDIRDDLFNAYVAVTPALNQEQQEEIVRMMKARGHDMVWNAIRYIFPSFCDLAFSLSQKHRHLPFGNAYSSHHHNLTTLHFETQRQDGQGQLSHVGR